MIYLCLYVCSGQDVVPFNFYPQICQGHREGSKPLHNACGSSVLCFEPFISLNLWCRKQPNLLSGGRVGGGVFHTLLWLQCTDNDMGGVLV